MAEETKKARKPRKAADSMLLLSVADGKTYGADSLGTFVANVKDVAEGKKYIREKGLSGSFVVVQVRDTLRPQVEQVCRVKFM